VLRKAFPVRVFRILFLEMAAIQQDQFRHIARGCRCENTTPEAVAHQFRQIAGMVEMGVGQDHGVDVGGRHRQRLPVQLAQVFQPLKQAAINQNALVTIGEKVFRAGDSSCTAKGG